MPRLLNFGYTFYSQTSFTQSEVDIHLSNEKIKMIVLLASKNNGEDWHVSGGRMKGKQVSWEGKLPNLDSLLNKLREFEKLTAPRESD
ncbi:hypothetical protein BH10ACI2_BH10ACI2_00270 [soil metagenome]